MRDKNTAGTKKEALRPAAAPPSVSGFFENIPAAVLGLTLFLVAFAPDEKLNRVKLMVFGSGLILAVLLWAVSRVFRPSLKLFHTRLEVPLAVYAACSVLYYLASPSPAVAVSELQRMIFSVGIFWTSVQVASGENGRRLKNFVLSGWMGGLFLISIYGILQRTGGAWRIQVPVMDRVFATYGNPIFFAAFLVASIPVALALLIDSRSSAARLGLFGTLAAAFAALLFTKTRAAFIALGVSLVLYFTLEDWRRGWAWAKVFWNRRIILAGISGALILGVGIFSSRGRLAEDLRLSSEQTHTLIWKDVLRMWAANPVFGTGYGTFHAEFPRYASDELRKVFPQNEKIVNDAHNEYLQILAETGLAGFLVFAGLFFFFFKAAFRQIKNSSPGISVDSGLLAGALALLVQNFFSVDMRFIVSSVYLFLAMGLVLASESRPFEIAWGRSFGFKALWLAGFVFISGLLGVSANPAGFYVAGVVRLSRSAQGTWAWEKTPALGPGLLPALLRPYLVQKELNRTPDFFDEKLLNAAQTISDLEDLVRQYPAQWKYWERLGYAFAKEIQVRTADGRKANDVRTAERAVAAYQKAYELNPQAAGPPNNLGNIFFTLNRRGEAIEWWNKALKSDPNGNDARLNLGIAYYYQGRIKESTSQFQEVLKRDPSNKTAIVMLKRMVE